MSILNLGESTEKQDMEYRGMKVGEENYMDPNVYLRKFLAELHRMRPIPGYSECDHSIGLGKDGELEIRLSAGDTYKVAIISTLDSDPVKAAYEAATAPCKFTHPAMGKEVAFQPPLRTAL